MAFPGEIDKPTWPPPPYDGDDGQIPPWLRVQMFPNAAGRPAILVAHHGVPYSVVVEDGSAIEQAVHAVAYDYLILIDKFLRGKTSDDPEIPKEWLSTLDPASTPVEGTMQWLPIWPQPGVRPETKPQLASWNLSREEDHALPALLIVNAAESYRSDGTAFSFDFGLTVPMTVVPINGGGLRLTVRSLSAELPRLGQRSLTELIYSVSDEDNGTFSNFLAEAREHVLTSDDFAAEIASVGRLEPRTVSIDELRFGAVDPKAWRQSEWTLTTVGKGRGGIRSEQRKESYQVVSEIAIVPSAFPSFKVVSTETCGLTTHAAPGDAEVFRKTPPGWFDPADDHADYTYSSRRPAREDEVLERYRTLESIKPMADVALDGHGFVVRLCPDIVVADRDVPGTTKSVNLPGDRWPAPRRDDFSAISAFRNSRMFFDMFASFGLDPETFVVRAQEEAQVFYRSGIFPGPGGDGRTINAQVAFDCRSEELPFIEMRYAIAQHTRWARPDGGWAQPLGIATSGRWVMHEFGHYLLAARLGKLEFDFAHSAGDAMAAVFFDPGSRLADTRGGVSENFRGYTYPFVFATRRHDREVRLGWAWYGSLNRSALSAPPGNCDDTKAYLTEQILSTSIFRLYRSLGGDTMSGDAPDRYTRRRAAHMTLFLLVRAIAGFGASPSVAEALELGMENAGVGMVGQLPVPPDPALPPKPPDAWEPALTHKTVRWAYEAQGMFPADPNRIHNAPGSPPPVDLYIADQRPVQITESSGIVRYGAGSYVPVSLDWTGERLWTVDPALGQIALGNRGSEPVGNVALRFWVGSATGNPDESDWDLQSLISWQHAFGPVAVGEVQSDALDKIAPPEDVTDALTAVTADISLLLVEVSALDDRANTDPSAGLPPAVPNGAGGLGALPVVPRRLTDLVANDNNLGLLVQINPSIV